MGFTEYYQLLFLPSAEVSKWTAVSMQIDDKSKNYIVVA